MYPATDLKNLISVISISLDVLAKANSDTHTGVLVPTLSNFNNVSLLIVLNECHMIPHTEGNFCSLLYT
jgi:hypothetical protein